MNSIKLNVAHRNIKENPSANDLTSLNKNMFSVIENAEGIRKDINRLLNNLKINPVENVRDWTLNDHITDCIQIRLNTLKNQMEIFSLIIERIQS